MTGSEPKLPTQQTEDASEQLHSQEIPAQSHDVFTYNGFHFEPIGKFPKNEPQDHIVQYTISRNELGMSRYNWAKRPYSHEAFYAASGGTTADVFLCQETKKVYVPGENELFEYTGGYELILPPTQQTMGRDMDTPVQKVETAVPAPKYEITVITFEERARKTDAGVLE